jgi:branched-chain amino acid transport system substrate-binding protein
VTAETRRGPGVRRAIGLAAASLAVSATFAGCGSKQKDAAKIRGSTLSVYSSVPLNGASRANAQAVVNGENLALSHIHYRIGRYRIVFKALDDSTAHRAEWDPGQTTINAKLAAQDPTTIGYVGEFNSGASAISIPILNRLGIPQISPASTAVGLTSNGPGSAPGEPEKYYPTGIRTFARIVPSDAVQAQALVRMQESEGCTKTYVLDDGEVDGHDGATSFALAAQHSPIKVVGHDSFEPKATDYSALAKAIASTGGDCVLISAITESNAVTLTKQIAAALPRVKLFGSAGVGESSFTDATQGGIPGVLDPRVLISVPTLDLAAYPASAQSFYTAYTRAYGPPQPYAIYGYEAMSLMLNAIARATDGGRRAAVRSSVVRALFATRDRHSVLGTYGIQHDGDTTLRRFGAYRIVGGRLSFWRVIDA